MRTIKFRAWDKERKLMIGSDYPNNWGDEKDEWYADIHMMDLVGIEGISTNKEFELMQFIGLKDKNGKEIYEGDICKVRHQTLCYASAYPEETQEKFMVDFIGVVEYREEQSLDGGFGGFYFEGKHSPSVICITTGEVIGNKFENPELLLPTPSK